MEKSALDQAVDLLLERAKSAATVDLTACAVKALAWAKVATAIAGTLMFAQTVLGDAAKREADRG